MDCNTIIQNCGNIVNGNMLYIKREDLIPFSFGGNKARKAMLFWQEIKNGSYDCVVTYGSGSSNHCRVVSNIAAMTGRKCYIISPKEASIPTFNSQMIRDIFGAEVVTVPVVDVHKTITDKINSLEAEGYNPYFIPGGGHGNIGTQAYVDCYNEIKNYEALNSVHFDYIFHASGTGTTQAGLICGQLLNHDRREIVGISIARKNPRGAQVIADSIKDYMGAVGNINKYINFVDEYVGEGYGHGEFSSIINESIIKYGIPLDVTYTAKAYGGMIDYLKTNGIANKSVLFIHTGGTPLFFDYLRGM